MTTKPVAIYVLVETKDQHWRLWDELLWHPFHTDAPVAYRGPDDREWDPWERYTCPCSGVGRALVLTWEGKPDQEGMERARGALLDTRGLVSRDDTAAGLADALGKFGLGTAVFFDANWRKIDRPSQLWSPP